MEAQPDLFATRSIALTATRATDKRRDELLCIKFGLVFLAALLLTWPRQLPNSVLTVPFPRCFASLLALGRKASRALCSVTRCNALYKSGLAYHEEEPRKEYDSKRIPTWHMLAPPLAFSLQPHASAVRNSLGGCKRLHQFCLALKSACGRRDTSRGLFRKV